MHLFKAPLLLLVLVTATFFSSLTEARVFRNSYVKFNMPDQWSCKLHKRAYICRHKVKKECQSNKLSDQCKKQIRASKEAIIILAAKEKSQVDSLNTYSQNLSQPKKRTQRGVNSTQSKVIHSKKVKINGQTWVDGMHLGSELPFYYTRYLASIKGEIAVLVTFSAHKRYYTKYSNVFFNSIKTLEVLAKNVSQVKPNEVGNKVLSRPLDLPADLLGNNSDIDDNSATDTDSSKLLFLLSFLIAAIGVYIWFKGRKKTR